MKANKEANISYWAHHFTTVVSVTLVLLMVGLIALIWHAADKESRQIKEQIELSVIMADSVPQSETARVADRLRAQPFAQNVTVISKQEALEAWKKDAGEDLEQVFGFNPLTDEVSFSVKAEYASSSKIKSIVSQIEKFPGVETVASPDTEMIDSMNANIRSLTVIFAVIAAIMLVISFVLINNTVHLTIYARRFSIHTMQLVGATNGFIRRPIIVDNLLAGLMAGVLAAVIIGALMLLADQSYLAEITDFIGWGPYAVVAGAVIVLGILLCALAALVSANIYLKKDYDSLFH